MLVWVVAMHCEAKPVIDYYRLKKSRIDHAFDLYRGDQMLCVISGIGKTAVAAASAWVQSTFAHADSVEALGVVIATHADIDFNATVDGYQQAYEPFVE